MATITSLGTGSGMDLESLVTKLMTVEKVGLTNLQKKQSSYETKFTAMGALNSVLSSLQTAAKGLQPATLKTPLSTFATFTAQLSNEAVGKASAADGAVSGTYSLEVTQLAQGNRLKSSSFSSSATAITSTAGTITLELGSMTSGYTRDKNIPINLSAGATLENLRNAINQSDAGVTATIINGTAGSQLVLTGPEGANNVLRLSSSDISGFNFDPTVTGTQGWSETQAAKDAAFLLNGIAATSHTNTVQGVLDGVTLELAGTNTGAPTTLKISQEHTENMTKALEAFVTAYNTAYSKMTSLGAYNAETKVAGELQGNSTLRFATTQVRQTLFGVTSGTTGSPYQTLNNIGVKIGTDGKLSLDKTVLASAIKADPTTVAQLAANVGEAYDTAVGRMTGSGGPISIATNGLTSTINDFKARQEKLQLRLDAIESRYRAQFSALDKLVSSLTSTGDFLSSFISSLQPNK